MRQASARLVLPMLADMISEQLDLAGRAAADSGADGIHDLRVATRRLRAGIELWLGMAPGKKLERCRKSLQRLGRSLGSLREADVDLQQLEDLRRKRPADALGIELALAGETRTRRRRAAALRRELRRVDLADVSEQIQSEIERSSEPGGGQVLLGSVARQELASRVPRLTLFLAQVLRRPTPAGLHRLRIEIKKFRYSFELCAPAYDGRRAPRLLSRLKELQEALGLVQDANALHGRIARLRSNFRRDGFLELERRLLAPMRAVAGIRRERLALAISRLESCRRDGFLSGFSPALRPFATGTEASVPSRK